MAEKITKNKECPIVIGHSIVSNQPAPASKRRRQKHGAAAKYSVSFQAILLRMLFLLETVAYAPNGLDLPLLVFKLIHFGPQALDM